MLYRKIKKATPELSILGFGCMRLPRKDNGEIDEDKATGMLRYAAAFTPFSCSHKYPSRTKLR